MKVETIGKMLIALGVVILLYATMFMPVALRDSDIINIHLVSERQNTLLIGGLLFIAGIMLFAVFKLKQTKEESEIAEKHLQERTTQTKARMESAVHKTSEGASTMVKSALGSIDKGSISTGIRILTGLILGAYSGDLLANFSAFLVSMYTENFIETEGVLAILGVVTLFAVAYTFRKISTTKVIVHLVCFTVIAAMTIPLQSKVIELKMEKCFNVNHDGLYCAEHLYDPEGPQK